MKLITCRNGIEKAFLGAVTGNLVVDLSVLADRHGEWLPDNMLDFIAAAPQSTQVAEKLLRTGDFPVESVVAKENVRVLAPIPRPRKNIFGIGLNYVKHVEESSKSLDTSADLPKEPVIFSKPPGCVIGYGEAVKHDGRITQQLDWEVELAVVIGRRAKHVSRENALEHVFGYSVVIDISARDCRRAGQWIVSKGQDTFAPMGPMIVTPDEVGDPHNLDLWLKKNGEFKQQGNTRDMLFKIDDLIYDIGRVMSLDPGDIIATGTPDGVGAGRSPQEWLWPGDYLEAGVQHIGELYHPIVNAVPEKNPL